MHAAVGRSYFMDIMDSFTLFDDVARPENNATSLLSSLEKEIVEMENKASETERRVLYAIVKRPTKEIRRRFSQFLDFFSIYPIDLDPYGIVKKLDHIVKNSEEKIKGFVRQLAPSSTPEKEMDYKAALGATMATRQIAKIMRHYLEVAKKYKVLQIAWLVQMQVPMAKEIQNAVSQAAEAFLKEIPIGDSIGPLIAAMLIDRRPEIYREEEFVVGKTKIGGKEVYVAKALGPGATTGYPGKFLKKFLKKKKITRIITIDAALKLEGEKTGSVAEGVGVAIGGIGVERFEIEEEATKRNIRLDAIVVKQSNEEAITPMKKEIAKSVDEVIERVREIVESCEKKEKILIIGVGNTCGVGNTKKEAEEALRNVLRKRMSA